MAAGLRNVLALAALVLPCLALGGQPTLLPAEPALHDSLSLLQTELEKARGAQKVSTSKARDEDLLGEPICRQLAGGGGEACDQAPNQPQKAAVASEAADPRPAEQAPGAAPAKTAGASVLAYILDALIVGLVLDGLRRWRLRASAANAEPKGWDGLMRAALAGDAARCDALLAKATSIAGSDLWGCTVLHAASKGGSVPVVKKLLEKGALVDEPDSWDETPLHLAARAGHAGVCELLLAHGAPADAANAQDFTPLVVAAEAEREEVCKLLMSRGAGVAGLERSALPRLLVLLLEQIEEQQREEEAAKEPDDLAEELLREQMKSLETPLGLAEEDEQEL